MAPGYNSYQNFSPYASSGNTGVATLLAQQHSERVKGAESLELSRMKWKVYDLEREIREMDRKPTVRIDPKLSEGKSGWWSDFFSDPFWEFFKRPSIK